MASDVFFISSKELPLIALRRSVVMIIAGADISLPRALQSKKILTFTDHLLLIIALSKNEGLFSTFSIRRVRARMANMTCKY